MKKALTLVFAGILCTSFAINAGALPTVAAGDIVTDGIVAHYDGANNANGSQNKEATVWADCSGKGTNFEVELDADNYWKDNALHVSDAYNYFDDSLVDLVNGDKYTVEIAFGEMENFGTDWVSYIISDNDAFSMFLRVAGDYVEFKSAGNARPKVEGGTEYLNNSTFTITFDINDSINMYIDGECIGTTTATETITADTLFLGHLDPQRNWLGDVYAIRFYDRALTAEEVAQNAASDNAKYRGIGGVVEEPVVEEPVVEEPVVEAPVETAPETVEEPVVTEAPAEAAPAEAPQTFNTAIIAAVSAVVSLAGYAVSKKR